MLNDVLEYRVYNERKVSQDEKPLKTFGENQKAAATRYAKKVGATYVMAVNWYGLSMESKSYQVKNK